MKNKIRRLKGAIGAAAAAAGGSAMAAGVDVSGVVSAIGDNETSIVAVGGAVLVLIVAAAAFKWIRRAL